ncbi:MAG: hypothetical protein DMD82_15420 [Candidatus Rokuibacteriota bacterium]|nr:MAG: hypothetical protein DMD82_15420 [Candidatus Rokubacteria bacterium]
MQRMRRESWAGRIARLSLVVVVVSSCAVYGTTGGIPRQPFADIPVPPTFIPFSNDWALIRSSRVTAARLVYQTALPAEGAEKALETSLKDNGWVLQGTEAIERAGFKGSALSFAKGPDTCRAEIVPSTTTTRVDLIIGRFTE